jgi:pilus assembly protein TadC
MRLLFLEETGKAFTPKSVRSTIKKYLLKAGITEPPYTFFGLMFYLTILTTFIVYLLVFWRFFLELKPMFNRTTYLIIFGFGTLMAWIIVPLLLISFIIIFIYFYLDLKIYNRTRKMEEILPDFLESVSANVKGGLSFEKSLWNSIKPRFGILSQEIALSAKKVMTGGDVDEALNEFAEKYDSPTLKRSMVLIIDEIQAGGKISDILDDIVDNLKKTKVLKEEMSASVISYMIFISAVVIFISPVLFALSLNLLEIIQKVTGLLASSTANSQTALPFSFKEMTVDSNNFILFSHGALLIIAIFSSMIVSIIEKGNIKSGIKYIPLFVITSQIIYIVCIQVMGAIFGNMIKF